MTGRDDVAAALRDLESAYWALVGACAAAPDRHVAIYAVEGAVSDFGNDYLFESRVHAAHKSASGAAKAES